MHKREETNAPGGWPPAWEAQIIPTGCPGGHRLTPEDEEAAITAAIEEHKIKPADQKRLLARLR